MRIVLALVLLALVPAAAQAGYRPGDLPPGACQGNLFKDVVGTPAGDKVTGGGAAVRVYGLTGDDWLVAPPTRAACLFGGQGDDVLDLAPAGGIAFGEDGADVLLGSAKDDALAGGDGPDVLTGRAGADILRGGRGVDGFDGGDGDDLLESQDGRPELVVCGAGADTAIADGIDVLMGCEKRQGTGKLLRHKRLEREVGTRRDAFRVRFVVPQDAGAGAYQVLLAGPGCWEGLRVAASVPATGAVRAGQKTRFGLQPPAGGWCAGAYAGTLVRVPPCPDGRRCGVPRPPEPIAYVTFRVTR